MLSGANLSESNVTHKQLQNAAYEGATLPEALTTQMVHTNPTPLSKFLAGKEDARMCNRDNDT